MLETVDFFGMKVTRLILGANPFAGYSHQGKARNEEMKSYHTVDRIIETWRRAEAAGINTMVTNNETPHVFEAVSKYLREGGRLQWIPQMNCRLKPDVPSAIDEAIDLGAKAMFFHGTFLDRAYASRDATELRSWCEYAQGKGVAAGIACHIPEAHLWAYKLGFADFHKVCFFNCGSVHKGKGERFFLADAIEAARCVQEIKKPCIAYKIMAAGRIEARMAFEYAFECIKPGDMVNVGMHRGDKDDIVEENVALVEEILGTLK